MSDFPGEAGAHVPSSEGSPEAPRHAGCPPSRQIGAPTAGLSFSGAIPSPFPATSAAFSFTRKEKVFEGIRTPREHSKATDGVHVYTPFSRERATLDVDGSSAFASEDDDVTPLHQAASLGAFGRRDMPGLSDLPHEHEIGHGTFTVPHRLRKRALSIAAAGMVTAEERNHSAESLTEQPPGRNNGWGRRRFQSECYAADCFPQFRPPSSAGLPSSDGEPRRGAAADPLPGAPAAFFKPNVFRLRSPMPVGTRPEAKPERTTRAPVFSRYVSQRTSPFPFVANRRGKLRCRNEPLPPRAIREQLHVLRRLFRRITHVIRHTTFAWHEEDEDSLLGDNTSEAGERKESRCSDSKLACRNASGRRTEQPTFEQYYSLSEVSGSGRTCRSWSAGELDGPVKVAEVPTTPNAGASGGGSARMVVTETEETFEDDGVLTEDVPDQDRVTSPSVWSRWPRNEVPSDEKDPTQRSREVLFSAQRSGSFGVDRWEESRRRDGEFDLCCLLRRLVTVLQQRGTGAAKDDLRGKERRTRSWLVGADSRALPAPNMYAYPDSGEEEWQTPTARGRPEARSSSCPVSALDLLPLSFIRTLRLLLVHPEPHCRVLAIEACTTLLTSAVQHRRFASLLVPNIIAKALLREPEALSYSCFEQPQRGGVCPFHTGRLAPDRRWPPELHASLPCSGFASSAGPDCGDETEAAAASATGSGAVYFEREAALTFVRVWTALGRGASRSSDGRRVAASSLQPCGAPYCRCVDLDLFTRPLLPDVFVYTVTSMAAATEDADANVAVGAQPGAHFRASSTGRSSGRHMAHPHAAPNRAIAPRLGEPAGRAFEGKPHHGAGAGDGQRAEDTRGSHEGRSRWESTCASAAMQWRVACLETVLGFGLLCPCILVETRTTGVLVDALTDVEAQAYNPGLGPAICVFLIALLSHRYPQKLAEDSPPSPAVAGTPRLACQTISPFGAGRGAPSTLREQFSACTYGAAGGTSPGQAWQRRDVDSARKTVVEDRCVCGRPLSSSSRLQLEQTYITELSRLCGVAIEIVQACSSPGSVAAAAGGRTGAGRGAVPGEPARRHQTAPGPVFQPRRSSGAAEGPTRGSGAGARATSKAPEGFAAARACTRPNVAPAANFLPSGFRSALRLYRRWILVSSALLCLSQSFSTLMALWRLPTGLPSLVRLLASPIDPCAMCWILRLFHAMLSYAVGCQGRRMTLAECDSLSNCQIDRSAAACVCPKRTGDRSRESGSARRDPTRSSLAREPAGIDALIRRRFTSGREDERPFSCPWASDSGPRSPFSGPSSPRRRADLSGLYFSPFGLRGRTTYTPPLSGADPFVSGSAASADYGSHDWPEDSDPTKNAYGDVAFPFASAAEAPDRAAHRSRPPGCAPFRCASSANQPVTRDIVETRSLLVARLMLHAQLHVVLAGLCSLRDDHHRRTADTPCLIPVIPSDVQFVPETLKIDVHGVTELSSSFAKCLLCAERGPAPRGFSGWSSNKTGILSAAPPRACQQRTPKDVAVDTRLPGSTLQNFIPFAAIVRTEAAHLLYALVHTVAAFFPLHLLRHKLDAETVFRQLRPPPPAGPAQCAWVDREPSARARALSSQAAQPLHAQSQEFYRGAPVDAVPSSLHSRWRQTGERGPQGGARDRLPHNRRGGQGWNELRRATNFGDDLRLRRPFSENYQANTWSEIASRSVHNVAFSDHMSLATLSDSTARGEQSSASVWQGPRTYHRVLASCFKRGSDSTSLSVISTLSLLHFVAAPPVRCGLRSLIAGGKLVCKSEGTGIYGSLRLLLRYGNRADAQAPQCHTADSVLAEHACEQTPLEDLAPSAFDEDAPVGEMDAGRTAFSGPQHPDGALQDPRAGVRDPASLPALNENGVLAANSAEVGCALQPFTGPSFVEDPYPHLESERGKLSECANHSVTTRMTGCQQKRSCPSPSSEASAFYDRRGPSIRGFSTSSCQIQEEVLRRLMVLHEEEEGQLQHGGSCPTLQMLSDVVPFIFGDSARIGLAHRIEVCWHAAPCMPMVLPRRSLSGGPASLSPPFAISDARPSGKVVPECVDVSGRTTGSRVPGSALFSVAPLPKLSLGSGVNQANLQEETVRNIDTGRGSKRQDSAGAASLAQPAGWPTASRGPLPDAHFSTPSASSMSALIELMNATGVLKYSVESAGLWDWQLISRLLFGPLVSHLRFLVAFSADLTRVFEVFLQQVLAFFLPSSCGFACLPWDMDNLHFLLIANALVSLLLIVPHNALTLSLPLSSSLSTVQMLRLCEKPPQGPRAPSWCQGNRRLRSVMPRIACTPVDKGQTERRQVSEQEAAHRAQPLVGRRASYSPGSFHRAESATGRPVGLRTASQSDAGPSGGLSGSQSKTPVGAAKRGAPDEETGAGLCGRRALLMEIAGLLLQELLLPPHVSPASACRCSSLCTSLSTPHMSRFSQGPLAGAAFPQTVEEGREIRTPADTALRSGAPRGNQTGQGSEDGNLSSSTDGPEPQEQHAGGGGSPEILERSRGVDARGQSVEAKQGRRPDLERGWENRTKRLDGKPARETSPLTLASRIPLVEKTLSFAVAADTSIVRLRGKRLVYHVHMRTAEQLPTRLAKPRGGNQASGTGLQSSGHHTAAGARQPDKSGKGQARPCASSSSHVCSADRPGVGREPPPSPSVRNEQLRLAAVLPRVLADHHTRRTLSGQYGAIVGTFSASLEGVIQLSRAGIFALLIQLIDQGPAKDALVGHFFPHLCLDFVPARRVLSRILSRGSLFLRLRCLAYWQRQILDDGARADDAVCVAGDQAGLDVGLVRRHGEPTETFRSQSPKAQEGNGRRRSGTRDSCRPGRREAVGASLGDQRRSESEISQPQHPGSDSDDACAPSSSGSNASLFAKTPRWAWQLQEVILKCLGTNQPALLRSEAIRIVTIVCRRKTRRAVRVILNLMETGKVSIESWPRVLQLQLLRADDGVQTGTRDGWVHRLLNEYIAAAHGDGVERPHCWEAASSVGRKHAGRDETSEEPESQQRPTRNSESENRLPVQEPVCEEVRARGSGAEIHHFGPLTGMRGSNCGSVPRVTLRSQTPLKRFVYVRLMEHLMTKVSNLPEIWETRMLGSKAVDLDLSVPAASSPGLHRPPPLGQSGGVPAASAFAGYPDAWAWSRTHPRGKPAPPHFPPLQAELDPGHVEKLVYVPGSALSPGVQPTGNDAHSRVPWIFHLLQREEAAGSAIAPVRGLPVSEESRRCADGKGRRGSASTAQSVVEAAFAQLDANVVVPGVAGAIRFRRGTMRKGGGGPGCTWMSHVPCQLQVQLVAILESRRQAAQLRRTGGGSNAKGEATVGERNGEEGEDSGGLGKNSGEGRRTGASVRCAEGLLGDQAERLRNGWRGGATPVRGDAVDEEDEDERVAAIIREKGVRIALEEGFVSEEAVTARMWIVEQFPLDGMVFADSVSAAQRAAMRHVCTSSSVCSVSPVPLSRRGSFASSSASWREVPGTFSSVRDDHSNASTGLSFPEASSDGPSDRQSRAGMSEASSTAAEQVNPSARQEQRQGRASALDGLVDLSHIEESYSLVSLGNQEHRIPVRKFLVPRRLLSDRSTRADTAQAHVEGRASRSRPPSRTKEDADSGNGEPLSPFLDVALRVRVVAGGAYADRTGRFQRNAERAAWEYLSRTEQTASIWEQMKNRGTAAASDGGPPPSARTASPQPGSVQCGLLEVNQENDAASLTSAPEGEHRHRGELRRAKDEERRRRTLWNSIGPRCLTFNMESFLPPEGDDGARRWRDSHQERAACPPQEASTLGPVVLCTGNFRWVFCMHRQPEQDRRDFTDFGVFRRRWEHELYMLHLVRLHGPIVVPRARRVAAAPPPSIISYLALSHSGCRVLLNHPTFLPYLESVLRRPSRVKPAEVCAAIWSVCQMASTSLGNEYLLEYDRQKERRRKNAKASASRPQGGDRETPMNASVRSGHVPGQAQGGPEGGGNSGDACRRETRDLRLHGAGTEPKAGAGQGSSPAHPYVVPEAEEGRCERDRRENQSDPPSCTDGELELPRSVNGEVKSGEGRGKHEPNLARLEAPDSRDEMSKQETVARLGHCERDSSPEVVNKHEEESTVSSSALLRLVMRIACRGTPPCIRSTCLHALSLVPVCEPAENAAAATHWDLAARGPVQERLFEFLAGVATGSEEDTTDTEGECSASGRTGGQAEKEKQGRSNTEHRPLARLGNGSGACTSGKKEAEAAEVQDHWIVLGKLVWAPPFNPPVPQDGRRYSSLFSLEKARGCLPSSSQAGGGGTPRTSISATRTPRRRSKQEILQRLEESQKGDTCLRDLTVEGGSRSSSVREDSLQDSFSSALNSQDLPYTGGPPRKALARIEETAWTLSDESLRPSYACFGSQHWSILEMISKLPNSVAVRISGLISHLQSIKQRNPSLFLSVELWWRVEQLMCLYCFSAHLRRFVASLFGETLNDPTALSYLDALAEHVSQLQGDGCHDVDGMARNRTGSILLCGDL
ncbi:conserved hypothetical protein [Neospora caninum Liverpool]|uniref:Rapamycin-insensitive companion of mTOR N-terminal domain-containing protein n=1 Tax=Neospora caninum (strain Liverpool) TaxID=572307 RepID=F0VLE6_NEOCL|nr:conserved hypothetical protein [Neospora caninum Liverpool]CBZ54074.1 conserved hypothetical protein [Neospora caninum Liverpool]CEL68770.1 TPA: hypothetical protein BN1204_045070 [Neospora caninum Liverpool]|eukprot:XP_003884105.1 conserved hypothetical protein [Neospora caninum Liverpool]